MQELRLGFLDVLNGMAHGPRGTPDPAAPGSGMSKTTMTLLALLGRKAYHRLTSQPSQAQAPAPKYSRVDRDYQLDDREDRSAARGGGLGDVLHDIFGRGSLPGPVSCREYLRQTGILDAQAWLPSC